MGIALPQKTIGYDCGLLGGIQSDANIQTDYWATYPEAIIEVKEKSGNDLGDYQVAIPYNVKENDRLIDEERNILSFWREDSSRAWAKLVSLPANSKKRIYLWRNSCAESISSTNDTFLREIDGVVGAWHFDEGEGTVLHDTSGNSNHGTIYGATWVDGVYGKALDFDGVDDYVEIPHSESLNLNVLTVCAWYRSTFEGKWFRTIISKYGYTGINESWGLGWLVPSVVGFYIRDASGSTTKAYDYTPDGTWQFLCGVANDTKVQCWRNGVLSESKDRLSGDIRNNRPVTMGMHYYLYVPETIDEVQIYNRTLSAEEISDLYNYYGYTTENYPGKTLVRKYVSPEPEVLVID